MKRAIAPANAGAVQVKTFDCRDRTGSAGGEERLRRQRGETLVLEGSLALGGGENEQPMLPSGFVH